MIIKTIFLLSRLVEMYDNCGIFFVLMTYTYICSICSKNTEYCSFSCNLYVTFSSVEKYRKIKHESFI